MHRIEYHVLECSFFQHSQLRDIRERRAKDMEWESLRKLVEKNLSTYVSEQFLTK